MTAPQNATGWFPDPTRRHRLRWSDGAAWTDWVADGTTPYREPILAERTDRRERSRRERRRTLFVAGVVFLASLVVLGAFVLIDATTSRAPLGPLMAELRQVEAPATVQRTRAPDVGKPAQIGLTAASVERTYRPAAGVSVEQATADLAAALEEQGYHLRETTYRFNDRDHQLWSGDCHATPSCHLDLEHHDNRITLTLTD